MNTTTESEEEAKNKTLENDDDSDNSDDDGDFDMDYFTRTSYDEFGPIEDDLEEEIEDNKGRRLEEDDEIIEDYWFRGNLDDEDEHFDIWGTIEFSEDDFDSLDDDGIDNGERQIEMNFEEFDDTEFSEITKNHDDFSNPQNQEDEFDPSDFMARSNSAENIDTPAGSEFRPISNFRRDN